MLQREGASLDVFRRIAVLVGLVAVAPALAQADPCRSRYFEPPSERRWIEARSQQYSIFHVDRFREDVPFVRRTLNRTERLMREKYGVLDHGHEVAVYLEPEPTEYAGVGRAVIHTWGSGNAGQDMACIKYLAPSAPAWEEARQSGATASLGHPFDLDYHAATLTHEYVTIAQNRVKDTKDRGYRGREPNWWTQGIQTYDGYFHSTETNRSRFPHDLIAHADEHMRDKVFCCRTLGEVQGLSTSDDYNGGALILYFLAETYGEEIHYEILNSVQPTWDAAFASALREHGHSIAEAFMVMRLWFDQKVENPPTVVAGGSIRARELMEMRREIERAMPSDVSCPAWTDDPIVPGVTPVKAVHVNEIRQCLNRILRGQ